MNAHINRDLVYALLAGYERDEVAPRRDSPQYSDYQRINDLLAQMELAVRPTLLVGTPLGQGGSFQPLEDIIAMWSVKAARQAAWDHSQAAWELRSVPSIQKGSLDAIDGMAELVSRGLLVRVM